MNDHERLKDEDLAHHARVLADLGAARAAEQQIAQLHAQALAARAAAESWGHYLRHKYDLSAQDSVAENGLIYRKAGGGAP